MARSLNKLLLIGNVGSDPELRQVGASQVASVSLATTESWKDRAGERQERTQWHRLSLWGALADIAERYVRKGDRLYVEGRVEYRRWEREDGTMAYATDVRVDELIMLSAPRDLDAGDREGNARGAARPRTTGRERDGAMYPEYPEYQDGDDREPVRGAVEERDIPPRERPDGLTTRGSVAKRNVRAASPRKGGRASTGKRRGR